MKKFFNASFEQVDPGISESFVKNLIDTARSFRGLKALGFFVFFGMIAPFILMGLGYIFENNMENTVVKLDENNEFIGLFSGGLLYILIFLAFVASFLTLLFYRDENRPKGAYIYNLFFGIYTMFCLILSFKFSQLFVTTFALRVIYNILFVFTFFYAFRIAYLKVKELTLGTAKQRPFLVEWFSRNFKRISPFLITIGGAYYVYKATSPDAGNMEQRILGNLAFLFPLAVALANFVYIYCASVFLRGYYVNKYSEQFRQKYGYSRKEWYGPNHKSINK